MTKQPKHGSYDGRAVRWLGFEAWMLARSGAWHETDAADIAVGAAVLSAEEFHQRFGHRLPPLPDAAFR
jgi:hypothetical protein